VDGAAADVLRQPDPRGPRRPWPRPASGALERLGPGLARRHGAAARRLREVTEADPFTALVLLAEIGDISRFGSARKPAAWAGLTATVRGSDRTVRHGNICKQGEVWVRWILCQAAQTAKRHLEFAASYQAIARRRGKKIATTAIARKLLTRAWHLLTGASQASSTPTPPATSAPAPAADAHTHRQGPPSPGRARETA
jgi:hypothetical protein